MNLYPGSKENNNRSSALFLRQACGEANGEGGNSYELSTNVGGGTPIIISKQTGRTVTFGWQELITLAIEAGIDDTKPIDHEGVELDLSIRSPEGEPAGVPVDGRGQSQTRGKQRKR